MKIYSYPTTRYDIVKSGIDMANVTTSNSMNVIIGLCHRFNRKMGTFQEVDGTSAKACVTSNS